MAKQEQFLNTLFEKGLVDQKKMAVIANAKALPGGGYGLCLLCVKDSTLSVYDTDFQQNVGQKICEVDLHQISAFKASSFVFNRYMKFEYDSFPYHFADFGNAKEFIDAVSAQMG